MEYPIIDNLIYAYQRNGWTGLELTYGKNLFNKDSIRLHSWVIVDSTDIQNLAETSSYATSDYIPVKQNESIYIPGKGSNRNALYDTNKNGYSYFTFSGGIYVPPIDGYIIITINVSSIDLDTYQVEYGNAPTPYEPYAPPSTDIKNRLKLPMIHYFPHPVIDSLQRAAAGTQTTDDTEILRHYLTPLGIGGI